MKAVRITSAAALMALLLGLGLPGAALGAPAAPKAPAVPTRAGKQYFEVRMADGSYRPIFVKGINLSVALPGKHPSEFPHDEKLYADWLAKIGAMNCNAVRVYTLHPPEFYTALHAYNTKHSDRPLWLIQGAWVEPPPKYDYLDKGFMDEVQMTLRHAVDVVHGNADFEERPGWVGGRYKADVSPWLLAWLIGREWEPNDIEGFHKLRPDYTAYKGTLISCPKGDPIECWFANICDYAAVYEQKGYSVQHPVAFSSWPPTDPLSHTSESNLEDEADMSAAEASGRTDIFSNDSVNITCKHFTAEPAFKAGIYASYHIYPYWPDFIDNEPAYHQAADRWGMSTYIGYLKDLKAFYDDRPLLVAEYGLPNGPCPAHMQSIGWSHGGLSEEQVASEMPRMTWDIYDSGCAGGVAFAWMDEWFKKVWMWAEMYDPYMDRRLWFSFYDPEKNYGMQAVLPGANGPTCTLSGTDAEWANASTRPGADVAVVQGAPEVSSVKLMHDEGYLYVRIALKNFNDWDFEKYGIYLGFDVLGDDRGNRAWPGPLALASDRGLEEVVHISGGQARLYQTETYRFWQPYRVAYSKNLQIAEIQPHILEDEDNRWGWMEPAVQTNRRRIGRDGAIYDEKSFDFNPLPRGSVKPGPGYNSQAIWNASPQAGVIELRMPWILLGFVGPHQLRVLQSNAEGKNASEVSPGVGVAVVVSSPEGDTQAVWPGGDGTKVATSASARYAWKPWTEKDIKWHTRLKPVYYSMQKVFGEIQGPPPPGYTPPMAKLPEAEEK
jgi:hypothetical protein